MHTEILVEGMHCAGCAGSIERTLRRVDGVKEVEVDRNRTRATVEHDDTVAGSALVSLINEMGFDARLSPASA